jgi:hypothetical protein
MPESMTPDDIIQRLIEAQPHHVFDGAQVRALRRPCVYIWLRDSEVLYVGKGSSGAVRPLGKDHHRLRDDAIFDTDRVLVVECAEGTEALIEQQLIASLHPRLNATKVAYPPSDRLIRKLTYGESGRPLLGNVLASLGKARAQLNQTRKERGTLGRDIALLKRRVSEAEGALAEERSAAASAGSGPVSLGEYGPVKVSYVADGLGEDEDWIGHYDVEGDVDWFDEWYGGHLPTCLKCQKEDGEGCEESQSEQFTGAVVVREDGEYDVVDFRYLRHIPANRLPFWLKAEAAELDDEIA